MRNDDEDLRDIHFEVYGSGKVPYEFRPWMRALLPIYRKNRSKASEYIKDFRHLASKAYLDELDEHARTINQDLFHAYHEAYEGRVEEVDNFVGLHELAEAASKEAMEDVRRQIMMVATPIPFAPKRNIHLIDLDVSKDVSR